jgi:hypothetical protein
MASRKNKNQEQGLLFDLPKEDKRWDAPQYEFDERAFDKKYPGARKFRPRREHLKPIHQRIQELEERPAIWKAIHAKLAKDMGL